MAWFSAPGNPNAVVTNPSGNQNIQLPDAGTLIVSDDAGTAITTWTDGGASANTILNANANFEWDLNDLGTFIIKDDGGNSLVTYSDGAPSTITWGFANYEFDLSDTGTWILKDDASTAVITATDGGAGTTTLALNASITMTTPGSGQTITVSSGKITQYNSISTAGQGIPVIETNVVAATKSTTQTNIINQAIAAAAGKYRITANQIVTATTGTTAATVGFTDASGAARTVTILFKKTDGTTSAAPAAIGVWSGDFSFDVDNSAANITLTFTVSATATYWPSGFLEGIA